MSTICDDLRAAILQAAMQGKITDSKIDDNTLRPLWSVTYWDKKFKEVSREKQPRTISYHHVLANFFKDVEDKDGDVFLLSTGSYEGYTTEAKAGEHLCEGEVVTIPWGGKPTIKYYKGKFVTSDNRIATSRDTKILDNRFLYYFMLSRYDYINDSYRGAALKHPEMKLILDMEIPVFPINEQMLIVQKLDELMPRVADLEQSADALASLKKAFPDNIKASLLQAAMQGKLTKQLPEDGNAEDLLKKIKAEKEKLIAEGKIKKQKPLAPITDDEIPFSIPDNWEWVRLGDITYNHGQKKPEKLFSYIDVGTLNNIDHKLNDEEQIVEPEKASSRARKIVHKGDVIYATIRPYLHNICIIDRDFSEEPIASTAFAIMSPYTGINNKYLFQALLSPDFDNYANRTDLSKGVAYPAIGEKDFFNGIIPLPPLAEQKHIVERLDALMQDINVVGDLIASE